MPRYLYTLRIEFEAADDVAAKEAMRKWQGMGKEHNRTLAAFVANGDTIGKDRDPMSTDEREGIVEKLQRLQETQPPRLVEWYR